MYDDRDKTWTVSAGSDYTCPHCDEDLYFEEEVEEDIILDIGLVMVNWEAHCPKCGRQYRVREVYKHDYSRIFELD